jgi:lipopolysaccharide biosynthesis glycosyltransferase
MEPNNNIQLTDQNIYPNEEILKKVLGRSYNAFTELLKLYNDNEMTHEWRYYLDGKAWLCKVQKKKRTIVWMSAWKGYMQAGIYMPHKYLEDVYNLKITEATKEKIRNTKDVGKSKPCIFEIRNKKALTDFEKVMQFKIENK